MFFSSIKIIGAMELRSQLIANSNRLQIEIRIMISLNYPLTYWNIEYQKLTAQVLSINFMSFGKSLCDETVRSIANVYHRMSLFRFS